MSLHVQIKHFEGPLGLLLHLIKKEEMDIFNINVHHITRQYFEYIKVMKVFDLEAAGDFIAMAATLMHIKSRLLLPKHDLDEDEEDTADPRNELVQRLLEYQRFKDASVELNHRTLVGRDTWTRGMKLKLGGAPVLDSTIVIEEDKALFNLMTAYRVAMRNFKRITHKVTEDLQSIAERILEIKDQINKGAQLLLTDLINRSKNKEQQTQQMLVTFLSLLELAKVGLISLFQNKAFENIYIKRLKLINDDVIYRTETYTYVDQAVPLVSEETAVELFLQEDEPEGVEADVSVGTSTPDSDTFAFKPELDQQFLEDDEQTESTDTDHVKAATDEEIATEERLLNLDTQKEESCE